MAEYDEFQEDGGDDTTDAGRGNNERREKALTLGIQLFAGACGILHAINSYRIPWGFGRYP